LFKIKITANFQGSAAVFNIATVAWYLSFEEPILI